MFLLRLSAVTSHSTHLLLTLLLMLHLASRVYSTPIVLNTPEHDNDDISEYDNEENIDDIVESLVELQNPCMCQNRGVCTPFNNQCTCEAGYTGMYCEVRMSDQDDAHRCGHLFNGQVEHTRCAECTCDRGILTCVGLAVTECDNLPRTSRLSTLDFMRMKGSRIHTLLKLVVEVETLAYQSYIEMHSDMRFIKRDIDSDDTGDDDADNERQNSTVLIALTSNKRLVGLHFKRILSTRNALGSTSMHNSVQQHQTAAGARLESSSYLFSLFLLFLVRCCLHHVYIF